MSPLPLWRPKSTVVPVFLVGAQVTGGLNLGDTLICEPGGIDGDDLPVTISYQWQRDNHGNLAFANIAGQTTPQHLNVQADVGSRILCRVLASSPSGTTLSVSNNVGPIVDPAVVLPPDPPVPPDPGGGQVVVGVAGAQRSLRGVKRRAQWRYERR